MTRFEAANLIRVFDFYLALMLLISLARRYTVYIDAVLVTFSLHRRWPNLLERIKRHRGALITPVVLKSLGLAVALMTVQFVCSRLIWPDAKLHVHEVLGSPPRLAVLLLVALPMLLVDLYFIIRVGRFDRGETETYLDQAEYWLAGWRAPAIHALTLGYVSPRRIVDAEVRKSLEVLGDTVSWASRWVSIQVTCRVACGLGIWLLWAVS